MKRNSSYWVVSVLCGTLTTLAVMAVPSWWTDRDVIQSPAETNDYFAINLGQLKNMASNAYDELQGALPWGGAGHTISNLANSFSNDNNYAAANLGQLKAVAEPFYARLIEVGYATNYPWTGTTGDDSDFSTANIGQLKNIFNFDPAKDTDSDGMPDWWEDLYDLNILADDAAGDEDGDGLTNLQEYLTGANPDNTDSDGDGLSDGPDSFPDTLYAGNESAQLGYSNPFVTNPTPRMSAIHRHPMGLGADGYALQVAADPDFQSILWTDDAGLGAARRWTRIWGSTSSEWSGPVGVDSNGTIYTAVDAGGSWDGQSHTGLFDFALCKWDMQGEREWTRMWGTADMEMSKALALDETNAWIYVAGETMGEFGGETNAGHYDACLTQLDTGGTQKWVRLWGTTGEERTFGVDVDPTGSVYVCGYTLNSMDGQTNNGQIDCFLIKFSTEGTSLWTRLWGSAQSEEPRGGLCVDTQGFVYVVGRTDGAFGGQTNLGGRDAFITKFSTSGSQVWTRLLGSSSTDEAKGIAIADDGSIYVGGQTWGAFDGQTNHGGADIFLTKMTPGGTSLWTRIRGGTASDWGGQISLDGQGNAYVLGATTNGFDGQGVVGGYDSFVCKFDSSGNHIWTHIWGSADDEDNSSLAADAWGHVYVSGFTLGQFDGQTNTGEYDLFLSRLDSEGGSCSIGPVADGDRCTDITYAGPPLTERATNYWRIRFFSTNGLAGSWSTDADYFILCDDTDSDGMPDWWENLYGLNPTSGLSSALAGWWRLDEECGTNALNSAANAYHGELQEIEGTTNSGWVADGKLGGALRFDGEDDWVRIAQSSAMITGGTFTISAWARLDSGYTSDWPAAVSDMSTSGGYTGYSMGYNGSSNVYGMVNGDLQTDTSAIVDDFVWVVLEYDGTNMSLYRNGSLVGSPVAASYTSATNGFFAIGNGQDSGYNEYWQGAIDDVRIYQEALGTNGLASMYDAFDDPDGDGLTNLDEYEWGGNPGLADTDGDGMNDGDEVEQGFPPGISNEVSQIWIHFPENGRRLP